MSHDMSRSNSHDHVRRVFSVDDDPIEVKNDMRYLEGLHDGLKYAYQGKSKSALQVPTVEVGTSSSANNFTTNYISSSDISLSNASGIQQPKITNKVRPGIDPLKRRSTSRGVTIVHLPDPASHSNLHSPSDEQDRFIVHDPPLPSGNDLLIEELSPNFDENDTHSIASSAESFTLRERQEAINKTHPFGIRIWKPALYKKQRSVLKAAAEDIHETKFKDISLGVHITNILWSITFGIFLCILFWIAGISVFMFGLATKSAIDYAKVFFKLGNYLLWPFGKVVYLTPDEHYLQEDIDDGISVPQFYKWVTSYSNKLFFHQSEAESLTNPNSNNGLTYPSYGSIQNYIQNQSKDNKNTRDPRSDGSVYHYTNLQGLKSPGEAESSPEGNGNGPNQRRLFGRGKWTLGRFLFYVFFHLVITPIILVLSLLTWLAVFTIPMSNILWNLLYHCRKHPLALGFKYIRTSNNNNKPVIMKSSNNLSHIHHNGNDIQNNEPYVDNRNVLLCTFRCAGWHYYKYTVDGTNIIVVNLISLVFFTIMDFYFLKSYWNLPMWFTNESAIFILCLASIIPLAFYIGQAVASISAQTSMGVGAVINAFFSTIVEIFLYCVALKQRKGLLVEGSMIGSILGAVLLLPGLSMCGGALNRKTQRYNPASAGVSSALLIFSMIVMFVPTLLYEIYGSYTVTCHDVHDEVISEASLSFRTVALAVTTSQCYFTRPPLKYNKMFKHVIQPMSISCAIVLFLAYAIGLWFTLRTHAKMIWQVPISDIAKDANLEENLTSVNTNVTNIPVTEEPTQGGHDAPNWSKSKSTWILLIATLLYAIIAEILVACVDAVLEDFPSLDPKFLGLTIFALVPNTTEFLNAISFAMHGNVALSMEIGSAYALQVCLLQIPALVIYSIYYTWDLDKATVNIREQMFPLVFPKWDLVGAVASIFMFTYLYAEGKSNYFKGSMLILLYVIIVFGFYFQGVIEEFKTYA